MKPQVSYVICAVQRSGSFLLCEAWNYFHIMLEKLRELSEFKEMHPCQLIATAFPNVHYIWIVRRDKVRQAVSWAKAGQTGIYGWHKGETPVPQQEPTFEFEFIDRLHQLILEGEAGWQSFFETCGVQPFRVVYEELVEDYEETALEILEYLKVPYPRDLVFGERRLQKQADLLNEEWVERYMQLKQQTD